MSRVPLYRRDVGMVFQNYALFPHMTAGQNVAFPLEMRSIERTEIKRRVDEALALGRLEGYANRYPRQLSGGQQQRIALARAVVFRPRLLPSTNRSGRSTRSSARRSSSRSSGSAASSGRRSCT